MKPQALPPDPEREQPVGHALDVWTLAPEGAAICHGERTAVIADVHLGYEWARGSAGDCVPAHSLAETVAKLDGLLARARSHGSSSPATWWNRPAPVAGPWRTWRGSSAGFASAASAWSCSRATTIEALLRWAIRDLGSWAAGSGLALESQLEVAGWTIAHGHRATRAARLISGHHHPVLRVSGHSAPCFLVGVNRIILPAFSGNAAGLDVATARLPDRLARGGPTLPCQHGSRPPRLRPARDALVAAWITVPPGTSLRYRSPSSPPVAP